MDEPRVIPLSQVKEILEREQSSRMELNYEQKLALEHAKLFARIPRAQAGELASKLADLKKLTPQHITKIVDVLPQNPDDVRSIFARERFQLEKEEIDKIIALVQGSLG